MLQRVRRILASLGFYGLWGILAVLWALTAYQVYVTLVFIGILVVENPRTRPVGWNTITISGLDRFLIFVLGAVWLVAAMLLEGYLREGTRKHDLKRRLVRLLAITAAIYGASYGLLLLLS